MKAQRLMLTFAVISLALSLAATLASYGIFNGSNPRILDASWAYRGWPLYWMFESWSYWCQPPHYTCFFQPLNFLIDFAFYAAIFQIPTLLYFISNETSKHKAQITNRNEVYVVGAKL